MRKNQPPRPGFTLIELAIVLVVLSTLLVAFGRAAELYRQDVDRRRTDAQLQLIHDALRGFVADYGRLPCPDNDRASDSAGFGFEDRDEIRCLAEEGWLPFATLGVGRADAWGRRFRYRILPLIPADPRAPAAYLRVCEGAAAAGVCGTVLAERAVAVVVSHGANGFCARDAQDRWRPPPISPHERENCNGRSPDDSEVIASVAASMFISHAPREAAGEGGEFDDQLIWLSSSLYQATLLTR